MSVSDLTSSDLEVSDGWLGCSEMARRVRAHDWSRTPLGALSTWSQALRSSVAICLRSPFPMAICWGPELICVYNDAERDVLGNLPPNALGLPARELLRDAWDIVGPQLQAVLDRGESTRADDQPLTLNRRGSLEVSYFTYSLSPIPDDDGGAGGVLLVSQDTTARVLAESQSDVVRGLITQSLDAPTARDACARSCRAITLGANFPFALIYLMDGSRATCMAARRAGRAIATTRQSVELDTAGDEVSRLFRNLADTRSGGALIDASRFIASDSRGRELPARAFVAPIVRGTQDPVEGFLVTGVRDELEFDAAYAGFAEMTAVVVGRSVAVARGREAERRRVNELVTLDQDKTDLFGNASHELRTPLGLIIGQLELLLEDRRLAERSRDAITVAHRSALRMLRLVNALLDFSRIDVGQDLGGFQQTDVARLTGEIAAMFQSAAHRAGVRLIVDCPPLSALACADPDAWERIVSNLLSNALKFTPDGEVRVSTSLDGAEVCLTVEDTGIGIAQDELDRIFSRFYRSPDQAARARAGAGIGLALVRELVHLHRGTIDAESRRRQGTRMTVRIPLGSPRCSVNHATNPAPAFASRRSVRVFVDEAEGWFEPVVAESGTDGPAPAASDNGQGHASQDRPEVLVVEDDADMRDYLRRLLGHDYTVRLARDGRDALKRIRLDTPNLVISDVMMPDMDGFGLLSELRRSRRTSSLPVILLSARAEPESSLRALELGADDYIVKPFGAPELLARIRTTLRNASGRTHAAVTEGRVQERARHEGELKALLDDLRAAQHRVAVAGDAERRRIERDLHDGAQQRLMALRLELALLEERLGDDPNRAVEMLRGLRLELDEAVEELRELAHGLYPPLLASDGLEAALGVAARRSAIPVTIAATGMTRAPRSIESTAYFCCLEALQNATKHAGPDAQATIELEMTDGLLLFSVCDNGVGFDPEAVSPGHGLINLRDRLQALGGDAGVSSSPGAGTRVSGHIPLP